MKYRAIILDFDGVILESNHIKDEAFKHVFSGYPQLLGQIMHYHHSSGGMIRFKKFKHIVESILEEPYDARREAELAQKFSTYVLKAVVTCGFVKGAQEFLNLFYPQTPLFLVSVNPRPDLLAALKMRSLDSFFRQVYATDQKAEAIAEILNNHAWKSSEVVFIGDAHSDYQACRLKQIDFLGRNSGSFGHAEPFKVFSDLEEIKNYLLTY